MLSLSKPRSFFCYLGSTQLNSHLRRGRLISVISRTYLCTTIVSEAIVHSNKTVDHFDERRSRALFDDNIKQNRIRLSLESFELHVGYRVFFFFLNRGENTSETNALFRSFTNAFERTLGVSKWSYRQKYTQSNAILHLEKNWHFFYDFMMKFAVSCNRIQKRCWKISRHFYSQKTRLDKKKCEYILYLLKTRLSLSRPG